MSSRTRAISAAPALVLFMLLCAAGCTSAAGAAGRIDAPARAFENDVLRVCYGADRENEGLLMSGITEFVHKPTGENFAATFDAHGYGYAKYHTGGFSFKPVRSDKDAVEVELRAGDGVVKRNRLFRGLGILEIEYVALNIIWWEDFYSDPDDDRVYSIYGLEKEIDRAEQARLRLTAEAAAGHNHGDAFLKAAGVSPEDCYYREHFIFGFYSRKTGRGLGFVQPASIGVHDGWKLWSMYNYEAFPFLDAPKNLPLRRWIFVVTEGREELLETGKAIAEAAAGYGPLCSVLRVTR